MIAAGVPSPKSHAYAVSWPSASVLLSAKVQTSRTQVDLKADQLARLSDEVGWERSLLALCAFRGKADRYPNPTVKKIPKAVPYRCECWHDHYSLQVENLPKAPPPIGQQEMAL